MRRIPAIDSSLEMSPAIETLMSTRSPFSLMINSEVPKKSSESRDTVSLSIAFCIVSVLTSGARTTMSAVMMPSANCSMTTSNACRSYCSA